MIRQLILALLALGMVTPAMPGQAPSLRYELFRCGLGDLSCCNDVIRRKVYFTKSDVNLAYFCRGVAYERNNEYTKALNDYKAVKPIPNNWKYDAYGESIKRIAAIESRLVVPPLSAPVVSSNPKATPHPTSPEVALTGNLGRRVALIIGNSAYGNDLALRNPINDASDVAAVLEKLGFEVLLRTDLDKKGMDTAFAEFAAKISDADAALFFYSGHAMELAGRNYLMPIDAKLESEDSARYEMARADDVLDDIRRAKGAKIFVLDACRDNPLAAALKMRSKSGGLTRGLAKIANADGILVAYATQAGDVAADGRGRNSPFTAAFLANIAMPGIEVVPLFRKIATDVSKATGGDQVPEFSVSGDLPEFYLSSAAAK